jgi:hypothetical protein
MHAASKMRLENENPRGTAAGIVDAAPRRRPYFRTISVNG